MTCLAFDIDGTIYDCGEIIIEAFQRGINQFNKNKLQKLQLPSKEIIVSVLGLPTDLIFEKLFPLLNKNEQQLMNDLCTDCLINMINQGGGKIFNKVRSTLEKFHKENYIILAASNGRIEYIESILKSNGLIQYFSDPIIVLNSTIKKKSDIIRYYKENICGNRLLIMIGDRSSDRIAASENNIAFIACTYGHADNTELEGVKWKADEFGSIYKLVKEIEKEYLL
jgi:phosphoglycolate phosphatase